MSKDCGKCPTESSYFELISFSRSGPKVPGRTSIKPEIWSTLTTPHKFVVSITTPANSGTAAPQTPERPPETVTGTEFFAQSETTSLTCSVDVGRHTTSERRGVFPFNDQCIASGHQSRECSTKSSTVVELGQTAPRLFKKSFERVVALVLILSVSSPTDCENSIGGVDFVVISS